MTNRKKLSKVTGDGPDAWLRCSLCFGTGYVFSPSRVGIKANRGGTIAAMTNEKCENCQGDGYVQYLNA
jgi:hypothetical protein